MIEIPHQLPEKAKLRIEKMGDSPNFGDVFRTRRQTVHNPGELLRGHGGAPAELGLVHRQPRADLLLLAHAEKGAANGFQVCTTRKLKLSDLLGDEGVFQQFRRGSSLVRIRLEAPQNELLRSFRQLFWDLGMHFVETNFEHCCFRRA